MMAAGDGAERGDGTEEVDWPALIGVMIMTKSALDEADPEHLRPYRLPRVPPSEDEIAAVEAGLGERLPAAYRDFLVHANGWPQFYFEVDLFGLPELRGEGSGQLGRELLASLDADGMLADIDLRAEDVLPVGAGTGMRTVYLLVRDGRPGAGQVSWIDDGEVDRYADFAEFFASMTAYHQRALERHQARGAG